MSYTCPTIADIEREHRRTDLPEFRAGDTVRVHALISEGGKERIQVFEGVCIHRKRGGARGSFTVRKVSHGVGVERVWPEASPRVVKVELVNRGRVRRAKLYYLRELRGNAARIRTKLGAYSSNVLTSDEPQAEVTPEVSAEYQEQLDKKAEDDAKAAASKDGEAKADETKAEEAKAE